MKKYIVKIFAPGQGHNRYKIWIAFNLIIQIVCTLLPAILLRDPNSIRFGFFVGSLGLALLSVLITKHEWQKMIAYAIGLYGLTLCFTLLLFDITNSGILIYLLAWSMAISVGYGREFYNLKAFFGFMSAVLVLFACALFVVSTTYYSGLERLISILSGTFVISVSIYLWAREAKMNSNHYSERRKKYEDIASLSGKMTSILLNKADLRNVLHSVCKETNKQLELDNTTIFLKDENNRLVSIDQLTTIQPSDINAVSAAYNEQKPILSSNASLTSYAPIFEEPVLSEIAIPIYDDQSIVGVIYASHSTKNFFRDRHYQALNVIASFCGIKIAQNAAEESIRSAKISKAEAERYKELDELKNRFIANISHDLKTPLSLIKAPAKVIKKTTKDEKVASLIGYILDNAEHLSRMVHQLLQLNRVEKGVNELYLQEVNVKSMCSKIALQYEERTRAKRINLQLEVDDFFISTDSFRLEQIIHNLVSNALRYTEQGGHIIIRTNVFDNFFTMEVEDNGAGIPEEYHDKVFERFFKIDENNQEGTGIGLSLVTEYVQILEGSIKMDSTPGTGTKFTISLPLQHSESVEIAAVPESVQEASFDLTASKPCMLVVEDHVDLNRFICSYFENDFITYSALDGVEALQKLHEQTPDIIITDLMMPNKDGRALVEEIRVNNEWSHIPIIVLSAKSKLESKVDLYELGVDNFLAKPFDVEELGAVVTATLNKRKALRELFRQKYLQDPRLKEPEIDLPVEEIEEIPSIVNDLKVFIYEHLDKSELTVNEIANAMGYGRNRFQREIKSLTGLTPVEFIRTIRLEEAKRMLKADRSLNVSEVAYAVGFSNLSYFSRSFKNEFGMIPSDYANQPNNA